MLRLSMCEATTSEGMLMISMYISCHIMLTPPFRWAFADHTRVWAQHRCNPSGINILDYKNRGLCPRWTSCHIMLTPSFPGSPLSLTWLHMTWTDMNWYDTTWDDVMWHVKSCHVLSGRVCSCNRSLNFFLNMLGLCQLDLNDWVGRCLWRLNSKL